MNKELKEARDTTIKLLSIADSYRSTESILMEYEDTLNDLRPAPSPADTSSKLGDGIDALAKESRTVGYRSQGLATRKPIRAAVKDAVNHFAESLKRLSGKEATPKDVDGWDCNGNTP